MGPVSLKNSIQKRVFWDGRNFAPGHFYPQSRHLVRLAYKIGVVRFHTKIKNRKHVFGKNELEWAFEAKLSKVFVRNNFAPERTIYSQLGAEKRYGADFVKKFQPKTCF